MPRKIVFVGNCQIDQMAGLFRRVVSPDTADQAIYTPSYERATPGHMQRLTEADVVVEQIHDWVPAIGKISTNARIVLVPHATGAFLWPYGGEAHIQAPEVKPGAFSPYPNELGDSFLNRMIRRKVDADEALRAYLAADVAKRAERLFEIHIEKQRNRDQLAGYRLAAFIEQEFRQQQLFASPNHPKAVLFAELIRPVFRELGVSEALIQATIAKATKIKASEAPIHPAVAAHFGLSYAGPERHYLYMREGGFTFEEYVRRYMRFEYNDDLRRGLLLAAARHDEAAAGILMSAVARSPRSVGGRRVLRAVLTRLGRPADALLVAQELVALEPENKGHREQVRLLSADAGQTAARPKASASAAAAPGAAGQSG